MNIITERLVLVPVSREHTQDIFENFTKQVTVYMFPKIAQRIEETAEVVERFIEQRENGTDYVYAITLCDSGEFIGLVGLHNLKDKISELGIWTKIESHGNHYGKEAIGALISHAKVMGIKKLCYPVDRRNEASKRIPVFYGGKLVIPCKEVLSQDKRILEIETYEITL